MKIDILTLFPEMLEGVLNQSIIGRAQKNNLIELNYVNIRDFANNKHNRVDDYPYGGGLGMVMQAQPIYDAFNFICKDAKKKPYTIYMSPQGKTFRQSTAKRLSQKEHIVILCGHYEGVDQRILDEIVDAEISIGDYVLTGGEIAAMAVVDATARLLPGVLAEEGAFFEESHYSGLLEYPQYTRPSVWKGKEVPAVLQSGNHKLIEEWKREMTLVNTFNKRKGMLKKAKLSEKEKEFVKKLEKNSIKG